MTLYGYVMTKVQLAVDFSKAPILKQLFYGTAFMLGNELLTGKSSDKSNSMVAALIITGGYGADYAFTKCR